MKIEIDLDDILGDENGVETMQESVRRQVVEALTELVSVGVKQRINSEVARVISETMQTALAEKMPALVDDVLNVPYRPVTRYGDRGDETTFRQQLIKEIGEQMAYKPARYDSDKNVFTKAVDSLVAAQMLEFSKLFNREVDTRFVAESMNHAAKRLAERLGVKLT